jgi:hypothetical protein
MAAVDRDPSHSIAALAAPPQEMLFQNEKRVTAFFTI